MTRLWLEWLMNMILALLTPMKTNGNASERLAVKKNEINHWDSQACFPGEGEGKCPLTSSSQ